MNNIILNNNMEIPPIGLGTWQITERETMNAIIDNAYKFGYRLIDTAAAYSNEITISKAIVNAGISRNSIFLSDKVWNTNRGFTQVQEACKKSLKKLKTDYFDIYLLHWPASKRLYDNWEEINAETWRGMEQLYKEGLVRAIGVCNFKISHLEALKRTAYVMPAINQVECHPGMYQSDIINYCKDNGIKIEASSPLGNGQILLNQQLKQIAEKKNRTVAQICIRWAVQKDLIVIPKTTSIERLYDNINIFDFELFDDEMKTIDKLPFCGGLRIDSDEVIEFG